MFDGISSAAGGELGGGVLGGWNRVDVLSSSLIALSAGLAYVAGGSPPSALASNGDEAGAVFCASSCAGGS